MSRINARINARVRFPWQAKLQRTVTVTATAETNRPNLEASSESANAPSTIRDTAETHNSTDATTPTVRRISRSITITLSPTQGSPRRDLLVRGVSIGTPVRQKLANTRPL